ncbi:4-alpha-glucanotransferase [Marinobacter zhanjiangensis]|uniref:4-alpha-glucanotransferase n=1 Tax=Marinobacter zhanjiangensis TaxID=578215 RepID=A0ABQ3B3T4_9GAMM|nr:4-alpha-glucanotransferase [Marinobacter zhanjiangensis]GGY76921.1 4-alpha-glucanotransferase [Marinobacter zhanjiangensis]
MNESALRRKLAEAAGLILEWTDSEGCVQYLGPDIQGLLLPLLGFPAGNEEEIRSSLKELERLRHPESPAQLPPLITADQGCAITLPCPLAPATHYVIELESGQRQEGRADKKGRIPAVAEAGYHQLTISGSGLTLAVAPARCFSVGETAVKDAAAHSGDQPARLWGLAAQLYSLRRPGDGGAGDTRALEDLCRSAAGEGAAAVTVSPTHAMFSSDPGHYGPYSPSSRLLRNALYCAPETIFGESRVQAAIARCGLEQRLENLESLALIDWPAVGRAKLAWLRALYEDFAEGGCSNDSALYQQFMEFREHGGETLEDHCRFEALSASQGPGSWRSWPAKFRDPGSTAVARFAREQAGEVGFHAFLQWLVADGLQRAQDAARDAGMAIGLIADLAVGANDSGSQAWSRQAEMLTGVSIGAPPDSFNVHGQDWGLCSFSPHGLIRSGFRSFIDMLRANFAQAGGLRIDHILGFLRLWLVPAGKRPDQGGYVRFPLEDMLRLTTLESVRHEAIVIGEDLGTVAPGFRERLSDRNILGMNVLWFERNNVQGFRPPGLWSPAAMAMTSTHDLPTVAGWWAGRDIEWREKFDLLPETETAESEQKTRAKDRARLARALGLPVQPDTEELQASGLPVGRVLAGCAQHLGRTPSPLAILPVEDLLGLEEQANLPGTITEHPNWRRRWSPDSQGMLSVEQVSQRLGELDRNRIGSRSPPPSSDSGTGGS